LPRSGLGHHKGLVLSNTIGLIDADYEGPCLISVWNRNPPQSGAAITIHPGDRIAQLFFTRIARPEFSIVSTLSEMAAQGVGQAEARRAGGFGSSGIDAACPAEPTRRNSREII
jgi:dUTP pyrophosphatase